MKQKEILFRKSIPEIKSTTQAVFGLYKYPAKFIPQVVAYILKNYAKPGIWWLPSLLPAPPTNKGLVLFTYQALNF